MRWCKFKWNFSYLNLGLVTFNIKCEDNVTLCEDNIILRNSKLRLRSSNSGAFQPYFFRDFHEPAANWSYRTRILHSWPALTNLRERWGHHAVVTARTKVQGAQWNKRWHSNKMSAITDLSFFPIRIYRGVAPKLATSFFSSSPDKRRV